MHRITDFAHSLHLSNSTGSKSDGLQLLGPRNKLDIILNTFLEFCEILWVYFHRKVAEYVRYVVIWQSGSWSKLKTTNIILILKLHFQTHHEMAQWFASFYKPTTQNIQNIRLIKCKESIWEELGSHVTTGQDSLN